MSRRFFMQNFDWSGFLNNDFVVETRTYKYYKDFISVCSSRGFSWQQGKKLSDFDAFMRVQRLPVLLQDSLYIYRDKSRPKRLGYSPVMHSHIKVTAWQIQEAAPASPPVFSWDNFRNQLISVSIYNAAAFDNFTALCEKENITWPEGEKAASYKYASIAPKGGPVYITYGVIYPRTMSYSLDENTCKYYAPHIVEWEYTPPAKTDTVVKKQENKPAAKTQTEKPKPKPVPEFTWDYFRLKKIAVRIDSEASYTNFMQACAFQRLKWEGGSLPETVRYAYVSEQVKTLFGTKGKTIYIYYSNDKESAIASTSEEKYCKDRSMQIVDWKGTSPVKADTKPVTEFNWQRFKDRLISVSVDNQAAYDDFIKECCTQQICWFDGKTADTYSYDTLRKGKKTIYIFYGTIADGTIFYSYDAKVCERYTPQVIRWKYTPQVQPKPQPKPESKPQPKTEKAFTTRFHNFEQHTYDSKDLDKFFVNQ